MSVGSVQLTWTASTTAGVTGYNVYRGTTTGGPYTKIASLVPRTGYTDSNLTSGNTYYYVVIAVAGNAESIYSNEAFVTAP
jgi:fibronectin type 3 domain-containing protein